MSGFAKRYTANREKKAKSFKGEVDYPEEMNEVNPTLPSPKTEGCCHECSKLGSVICKTRVQRNQDDQGWMYGRLARPPSFHTIQFSASVLSQDGVGLGGGGTSLIYCFVAESVPGMLMTSNSTHGAQGFGFEERESFAIGFGNPLARDSTASMQRYT